MAPGLRRHRSPGGKRPVRVTSWCLREEAFPRERLGHGETVFTLGNGYLGTRGATEEAYLGRQAGVYLAGLYDRALRDVPELPVLADWLSLELELAGERFDLGQGRILAYDRRLDLKRGLLTRRVRWESPAGRRTLLRFQRFVSAADAHLMGLALCLTPENYAGTVSLCSRLDGKVTNAGTQHFVPLSRLAFGARGIGLLQETAESHHLVGMAAAHRVAGVVAHEGVRSTPRTVTYHAVCQVGPGQPCTLEKLVTVYASRDREFAGLAGERLSEALTGRTTAAAEAALKAGLRKHLARHAKIWAERWRACDIRIEGDRYAQGAVRVALFHLLQMAPWEDDRVSIPAKGLSGEGYRGHVFWDADLFLMPFFLHTFPPVARNLLRYRHHTLSGARRKAEEHGYDGAMYPWESAGTGDEVTPREGDLDPVTRRPVPIRSGQLEQHISGDVAYAFWRYYLATGERDFLAEWGAEVLCLTARFWASRTQRSRDGAGYEIKQVMGPDEFAECVDNNFFTNALVRWHLRRAVEACRLLASWGRLAALGARLTLTETELARWLAVAGELKLSSRDGVWEQYDGFFARRAVAAVRLRGLPGGLQAHLRPEELARLQVIKQPDVLMLIYLLAEDFTPAEKRANWEFYEPKTVHESSLSPAIHAILGAEVGADSKAYAYFRQAAGLDLEDALGNTASGLHAAALGGLWQAVVHGFGGVRLSEGGLTVRPALPRRWRALRFPFVYRGARLACCFTREEVHLTLVGPAPDHSVRLRLLDRDVTLNAQTPEVSLRFTP